MQSPHSMHPSIDRWDQPFNQPIRQKSTSVNRRNIHSFSDPSLNLSMNLIDRQKRMRRSTSLSCVFHRCFCFQLVQDIMLYCTLQFSPGSCTLMTLLTAAVVWQAQAATSEGDAPKMSSSVRTFAVQEIRLSYLQAVTGCLQRSVFDLLLSSQLLLSQQE